MKLGDVLRRWTHRDKDTEHEEKVLARVDRTLMTVPAQIELYRHQLEVLTGRAVTWPYVERRKKPRD